MPTPQTRTFFALRDKTTGQLARIASDAEDRYMTRSGDDYYWLSQDDGYPVFEATSLEVLANVLFEDTPGYNSRPDQPGWGDFGDGALEAVAVTVTTEMTPVELPRTLSVKTIEVRTLPMTVARRYVGHEFQQVAGNSDIVFWLVELPEGESLESAQAFVGTAVFGGDRWTKRILYAAVAVPEEYIPLTATRRACALFIGSGLVH